MKVSRMTTIIRMTDWADEPAEILAAEAVVVDLVDQDVGRLARTALGERSDDAEGADEGVDDVDHQEEEAGRREQRKDDVPEAPAGPAPSIAAASISDFGIDCRPARKNRKL